MKLEISKAQDLTLTSLEDTECSISFLDAKFLRCSRNVRERLILEFMYL